MGQDARRERHLHEPATASSRSSRLPAASSFARGHTACAWRRGGRGGRVEGARPLLLLDTAGATPERVRVLGEPARPARRRRARGAHDGARTPRAGAARQHRRRDAVLRAARALERGLGEPAVRRRAAPAGRALVPQLARAAHDARRRGQADGRVPASVDAPPPARGSRPSADGVDSMLYLGLLDREAARELLLGCLRRELATG